MHDDGRKEIEEAMAALETAMVKVVSLPDEHRPRAALALCEAADACETEFRRSLGLPPRMPKPYLVPKA